MLQTLLAARCQLKIHVEDRPGEIYALVALPKGIKLTPVKFDGDNSNIGAIHYERAGMEFTYLHGSLGQLPDYTRPPGGGRHRQQRSLRFHPHLR
jgi:uncharacterized protein (TIGR03435 family)